jgi:hypothetical protein
MHGAASWRVARGNFGAPPVYISTLSSCTSNLSLFSPTSLSLNRLGRAFAHAAVKLLCRYLSRQ